MFEHMQDDFVQSDSHAPEQQCPQMSFTKSAVKIVETLLNGVHMHILQLTLWLPYLIVCNSLLRAGSSCKSCKALCRRAAVREEDVRHKGVSANRQGLHPLWSPCPPAWL